MKRAFTLIEAIIVIGIIVILAGLSSLSLVNFGKSSEVDSGKSTVIQGIRLAQSNSLANLDDSLWGVHFESDRLMIYQDNPSSVYQTKILPSGTTLSFNIAGEGSDILFNKGKATTANTATVTILSTGNTQAEITVNSEGRIDY